LQIEQYDELFEGLPVDAHAASYELLMRISEKLLGVKPTEADYTAACGLLEAFYEANDFKIPSRLRTDDSPTDSADELIGRTREGWRLQYEAYRSQIMANRTYVIKKAAKDAIAAVTHRSLGYAVLDQVEKKKIHGYIDRIRRIIEQSQLEDRKKNKLFDSLSGLSKEVDRNGTPTDRFFIFMGDVGLCLGELGDRAKPLFNEVKEMLKLVVGARARNENAKLPANGEVLSLPELDATD
jgi:hypothetical protein